MIVCTFLKKQPAIVFGEPLRECGKVTEYGSFVLGGQTYSLGEAVYLPSDVHKFPVKQSKGSSCKSSQRDYPDVSDEAKYPELYRKSEYIKGSNSDVPKPFQIGITDMLLLERCNNCFCVGQIIKIVSKHTGKHSKDEVGLTLEMFYRYVNIWLS